MIKLIVYIIFQYILFTSRSSCTEIEICVCNTRVQQFNIVYAVVLGTLAAILPHATRSIICQNE